VRVGIFITFVFWIVLTIFYPIVVVSQEKESFDGYCSYYGDEIKDDVYSFTSDREAEASIKRILDYTGIVQNFVVRAANVPNAMATIVGEQRAIYYNQDFMIRLKSKTRTDWAATSIMAHEIGHHLQGHTIRRGGSRPGIELEADKYSGFILQKMGASLKQAKIAMTTLGSTAGSPTHPPKSARVAAITNGWRSAQDLSRNSPDTGKEPGNEPASQIPPVTTTPTIPSASPKYASRCVFPGEPNVAYYVTSTNDIVGIPPNGQVTLVGKKIPPTAPGFAWMYQTAYVTYGVDFTGRIFNRAPNGMPFQIGHVTDP
jgi:hypothetical protein